MKKNTCKEIVLPNGFRIKGDYGKSRNLHIRKRGEMGSNYKGW